MAITLGDLAVRIGGDQTKLNQALDQAEKKARAWTGHVSDFISRSFSFVLGNLITDGIRRITGGLQNLVATGISAVSSNERLRLSLQSLVAAQLTSANSTITQNEALQAAIPIARELEQWIRKLAILSPFDEQGAAQALQTALNYKFTTERSKELIQALTDQAAASGKSTEAVDRATVALGQMNLKGKVSAEELNQLREAGVNTAGALDIMGVSLDDVAKGTVSADDFIDALLQSLQSVEGAAARQAATWDGLFTSINSLVRTGLKEFFEGVLDPLRPLVQQLTEGFGNEKILEGARELGRLIGEYITPAVEFLSGQLGNAIQLLERVGFFVKRLRDELGQVSASDLLGQIGPGLEEMQQQLDQTLETLGKAHEGTLEQIRSKIEAAGESLAEKMAEIGEKYGPQIAKLQERITRQAGDFAEQLTERAEAWAKRRNKIEESIVKTQSDLEEKLTELKLEHTRRRQQLSTSLLTATSEEEYLRIQDQIRVEDERYKQQAASAKESGKEQVDQLKDRLKEEEEESAKAEAKLKRRRDRALSDLNDQLQEIQDKRSKEESEVRELYDSEVEMLQNKITRENELYAKQIDEQTKYATKQMAAFQADLEARAAALGQGLPAQLTGWIGTVGEGLEWLKKETRETLDTLEQWWREHGENVIVIVDWFWGKITSIWDEHGDYLTETWMVNWGKIGEILNNSLETLGSAVDAFSAAIRGDWKTFWTEIVNVVKGNLNTLEIMFGSTFEKIGNLFDDLKGSMDIGSAFDGLIEKTRSWAEALGLVEIPEEAVERSPSPFEKGLRGIKSALDDLQPSISKGLDFKAAGVGTTNQILNFNPTYNLPQSPAGFDGEGLIEKLRQMTQQDVLRLLMQFSESNA